METKYLIKVVGLWIFLFALSYQIVVIIDHESSDSASSNSIDIFKLHPNQTYEMSIDTRSRLNLTINSERIVKTKVYTSEGIILKYKSNLIKVRDKIDFLKIENGDYDNSIRIIIERIKRNEIDLQTLIGLLASVIIILEHRPKMSALALIILLSLRVYNMQIADDTHDRVFKKYVY